MDHTIIPQEWKKFLGVIQSKFPSAIIAGGALRDLIVDNPIKDVDIFIADLDTSSGLDFDAIGELIGLPIVGKDVVMARDHIKVMHDIKKAKMEMHDKYLTVDPRYVAQETFGNQALIESFINYIIDVQYDGIMYQLIFIEQDPVNYVYTDFDFGICKIYFDGIEMVVSEEFWYDLEHKQLTMSGKFSAGQMLHTMYTHRPNLIKKFPGWKVVIDDLGKRPVELMPPSYQEMLKAKKLEEQEETITYVYTDPMGVQRTRTILKSDADAKAAVDHRDTVQPRAPNWFKPGGVVRFLDNDEELDYESNPVDVLKTQQDQITSAVEYQFDDKHMAELIKIMNDYKVSGPTAQWVNGAWGSDDPTHQFFSDELVKGLKLIK